MLADQGLGNQKRHLWQVSRAQVAIVIGLLIVQTRIENPLLEVGQSVVALGRDRLAPRSQAKVVTFPANLILVEQIGNRGPVQLSAVNIVGRVATTGTTPQGQAIGRRRTKLITEVVTTQREVLRQLVVVRKVRAVIIPHGIVAIGGIETIHLSRIPLAMNGLPGMRNIGSGVGLEMVRINPPALSVWL